MIKKQYNAEVPALGFGTYPLLNKECIESVRDAIGIGYRHIDTADIYHNETEVGEGIKDSGVAREKLFVTTKIWHTNLEPEKIKKSAEESLNKLQMEYVDLLLIHWPSKDVALEKSIEALLKLQDCNKTKHIGVSNFPPALFTRACKLAEIFTNQIEFHPYLIQNRLLQISKENNAFITAYSPLAQGKVNEDKVLLEIGEKYGKTASQVTLRWLIQQDKVLAIPKAGSHKHRVQNFDIFDFELTSDEMSKINVLNKNERLVNDTWSPNWDE